MASRDINDLHPDIQGLALRFLGACESAGNGKWSAFITCTYRSNEEQDADYAQGRTEHGKIITNARAGQSAHNVTLTDGTPAAKAFDFAIKTPDGQVDWSGSDAAWLQAISIGVNLGLVSGSTFSMVDRPHFELPNWQTLS